VCHRGVRWTGETPVAPSNCLGPGNKRHGIRCSTPELHGHKSRGRSRTCDHPLMRRSNRSLHHRPDFVRFCALPFSIRQCLADRSNFFTIALSLVNGHPISSPSQLHLPALNEIPHRAHRLAGEPTRRADSRQDFSRYLVLRGYAPVPGALILGRAAALRVVRLERSNSSLSPPANLHYALCAKFGQGTSGHGRACAHEDSNLTARRLFRLRSIRGQTPLTL